VAATFISLAFVAVRDPSERVIHLISAFSIFEFTENPAGTGEI